jgi:hypothetical protein
VTKLIKAIEKWPGWRVENAAKGFRVYPPDKSKAPITIHKTPSDNRWKKNLISELRRAGAPL